MQSHVLHAVIILTTYYLSKKFCTTVIRMALPEFILTYIYIQNMHADSVYSVVYTYII